MLEAPVAPSDISALAIFPHYKLEAARKLLMVWTIGELTAMLKKGRSYARPELALGRSSDFLGLRDSKGPKGNHPNDEPYSRIEGLMITKSLNRQFERLHRPA